MDCYLVDILYLSEDFLGARMGNCDIKPTDGAKNFAYLRTRETSGIEQWIWIKLEWLKKNKFCIWILMKNPL